MVKRVLHIVSTMDRGGAETLIMNIYRNIDRKKIQFNFITHTPMKCDFEDEIIALGGRIFKIPSLGQLGPFSYVRDLMKIMSAHSYEAVHIHTDFQGGFPALAAKLSGIKIRICHSHSNSWPRGNQFMDRTALKIFQTLIKISSTRFCSCSSEAAEFLFGKRSFESSKVKILNNGIDLTQFENIQENRNEILRELDIPVGAKIIGHVGRFSTSKNQTFILKVLKKLLEKDKRVFALLVGDGPLKQQIEEEALKLGIVDHIRFLGVRSDIPRLMRHFDVFLFPSLFEGFGIVTIEAQSSGTPCIMSDMVPRSTDMGLGLVTYLSLDESIDVWGNKLLDAFKVERPNKQLVFEAISKNGFSIKSTINDWLELYGAS
ncbi:glycosyltransferase family 1 protein [Neobacillus sp. PS3-12]|jgi:glycosyltransferase EpsF|uniref:glycosyltransferase family 1 protein n=1 Tax=Neobacillus sp. PS3-12 TaxID=3070677 RepID=UPI0027DFC7CB|nr:glycosyltransferase family 1 protein [Neobacillus sp. PS3-12]WML51589.1 glycosyltransferase family 1 protein [Neobacillus sp. PS3-12]